MTWKFSRPGASDFFDLGSFADVPIVDGTIRWAVT